MTTLARVPPGRAGRLWLRRRLAVARRGVDLLQRKVRILARDHHRLAATAERTGREWAAACAALDGWALRNALANGRRSLRQAPPAGVTVRWTEIMGVRHPAAATYTPPGRPPPLACSAALAETRAAARAALRAAVDHAVAVEAERRVAEEIAVTRLRIRGLQDRWIPRLTAAIKDIDLELDEMERSDAARLLRAGPGDRGSFGRSGQDRSPWPRAAMTGDGEETTGG